jgi:hypothetical protein
VWRRHDIFAVDDAAAIAVAGELFRVHAEQRTLVNFCLCEGTGRFVYESRRAN